MTEKEEARILANKILDRIDGDPDDDLAMLSRQLLRADESIASFAKPITQYELFEVRHRCAPTTDGTGNVILTIDAINWLLKERANNGCELTPEAGRQFR